MIQKSKRLEFGKPKKKAMYGTSATPAKKKKKKAMYGKTPKVMRDAGMRSVKTGMDNNPEETKADFLPTSVQKDIAKNKGKKTGMKAGYGMSPGKVKMKAGKSPMKAKSGKSPMKDRRKKK
tara:strand:+ start:1371 stop:1733 length:363 start_codon:yes stop_codon:yes gene_type:complete